MSEIHGGQTGPEAERYSDEYLAGIVDAVDNPAPKDQPGRVRRWYQNKALSVLGAVGLGFLVGASGACKKKDETPDLDRYAQGCLGKEDGKKFVNEQRAREEDCIEHKRSWMDQRRTPALLDLATQQSGRKVCRDYETFLLVNQKKADKGQRNLKLPFERRKMCRMLWRKLERKVGENELNQTEIDSNY